MPEIQLTFVSKPDCHLCETARDVVDGVVAELGSEASVHIEELSILEHPDLYEKYVEEIPVVLINGKVHNIWRIDPTRLKNALLEASA
ncbi:glutaredoxin [Conyzicola nivalis]|uniref:Glutaredoxin n=1 Tax=Conyzicola nivalis TaxID=1477021 RepID=A0ABV2QPW6_9MICO